MIIEQILKDGCFTYTSPYLACKTLSKINSTKERAKSNCRK